MDKQLSTYYKDGSTSNDQNVIVQVTHDLAGRMTDLRDPRGNLTRYEYDGRNRRTRLTNPLAHEWSTAYADLSNGGTRTTQTYPGLGSGGSYDVTREFDQLGRLSRINYNSATTPNVAFNYDIAGNRTQMTERTGTTDNRITHFGYDDQRRLTSVGFDSNGDGTVDETVRYNYDAGGNRTQMTLPGSKTITYSYDEVGRLIGLTAWGNQHSDFHYDKAGRHVGTQRPNGLSSDYAYNPAGHLRRVRHRAGSSLRGQFNYTVDGRGNRTRAFERLAQSTTVSATYNKSATQVTFTRGTWTDAGDFKQTAQFSGRMQVAYTGDEALLTIGTGPDHGQFDLYINDRYWRRFNTYTAQPGEQVIHIPAVPTPPGETSGKLSIEVRSDNHFRSTGRVFRFKQLAVIDTTYTDTTIDYTYDALSRLQQANYNTGQRIYDYNFDLAGNRTQEALSGTGVTAKTTDYTYNATNQLTNDGTHTLTYDANGNLTNDGTNTYTWDHANRLLKYTEAVYGQQMGFQQMRYTYDGLGNRVRQLHQEWDSYDEYYDTVKTVDYLLDLQPGLVKVLAATTETNANHYIHAPQGSNVPGIHAMQSNTGDWSYMAQDGLGSVRSLIDSTLNVSSVQNYAPYGEPFGTVGNFTSPFAFTGEQTDANAQLYLRARYYNPSLGVFNSRDPFEGLMDEPLSLNGYSYAHNNPVMNTDPSGQITILGAIGAVVGGAAFGALGAVGMRALALSGACGERMKCLAENMDFLETVKRGALAGGAGTLALMGLGAVVGSGTAAAALGGVGAGASIADMIRNRDVNPCNFIGAGISAAGGLSGGGPLTGPVRVPLGVPNPTPPLVTAGGTLVGGGTTTGVITLPGITGADLVGVGLGSTILFSDASGGEGGENDKTRRVSAEEAPYVYRGDERSPGEIKSEGFRALRSGGNGHPLQITSHVSGEPNTDGQEMYVSTARFPEEAAGFGAGGDPGYIYRINNPGTGYDVVDAYNKARIPIPNEVTQTQEVVFLSIDVQHIDAYALLDFDGSIIGAWMLFP